ncbi:hypothetical protein L7F22_021634 [Adiantum nelumboides]|nr:hypothetical protein [Adiantum nelumboides]
MRSQKKKKKKCKVCMSARKEVRKLQEACDRLRDTYVDEFEDESSDDDDGWVGLETDIHHVGIPKMEEKEVPKEVGQESLKLPLDIPTLPLECAHRVEMENPLLKLMSVLSLVNEIYYSEEKQIINIEDVVHKNQRPLEEADNVRNGQVDSRMNGKVMVDRERNEEEEVIDLFFGSIENVCRITNEESKQEEVSKIRCTHEEFAATTMNKSILEELLPRRSTDVNMQLAKLVEIAKDIATNDEVIFGNANGAEFYHGNCQAICQVGNQADDVNGEVEDVQQNTDLMSKYAQHAKRILEKTFFAIEDFCQNLQKSELMIVEVAVGIQDLQKDLKSGSRIAELQTKLADMEQAVENEYLIAEMQEMRTNHKEIEDSLSKLKAELSSGVLEPDQNLAVEVESNVEKQADPDFVAEKPVEADAEGDIGEQPN